MRLRSRQVICGPGSPPLSFTMRQPPMEGNLMTELWWSVILIASTLSLSRLTWCCIFSRFVPLGGATSLVMTNLPELRASLKRDDIALPPLVSVGHWHFGNPSLVRISCFGSSSLHEGKI